ncbi:MAG: TrkH family potassium uptake protein [Clostridia bacterium]|nr:TrkH family potassium uptake protein [Clostridia bacterium]MBR6512091.1 TrkH family potassium uptake protein [Clostridia bacterium]
MEKKELNKSYYLGILKCLSYPIFMVGVVTVIPSLLFLFYPEEKALMQYFAIPGIAYLFLGYLIRLFTQNYKVTELKKNSAPVVVLLIWIISIFLGAIPFFLTKDYSATQALFEATSGFTTTGFTVTNFKTVSHMVLLYRSLLHLLGGVGLILILSLLVSDAFGMQLFKAEGHLDKIEPSVSYSARTITIVYLGLITGGTILYTVFGMPLFDSINHAISAVSTGGFSTKAQSIGYWHNVPVDVTTVVLMMLGATNFMATVLLFKGKFMSVFKNSETLVTLFFIAAVTPIVIVQLFANGICEHLPSAIDNAVFQVVAVITTTGLSTVDNFFPKSTFALMPLIVLMFIGGNSGSTAGGMKAYRVALALRSIFYDARSATESNRIHRGRYFYHFGKKENFTKEEQNTNNSYLLMYLAIGFIGTFALCLCGYDFKDSLIEFFSALGTVGMSSGIVGRDMSNASMWIIMVGMIIARLEIYIFILSGNRIIADIKEFIQNNKKK